MAYYSVSGQTYSGQTPGLKEDYQNNFHHKLKLKRQIDNAGVGNEGNAWALEKCKSSQNYANTMYPNQAVGSCQKIDTVINVEVHRGYPIHATGACQKSDAVSNVEVHKGYPTQSVETCQNINMASNVQIHRGNGSLVNADGNGQIHNSVEVNTEKGMKVFNNKHVADSLISVLCSKIKDVSLWDETDINTIVNISHQFYDSGAASASNQSHSCISKLPKVIKLFENRFKISFWKSYLGDLENILDAGIEKNRAVPSISFDTALKRSLCGGFSGALISLGDYVCSVILPENRFYMFDPQIERINQFANVLEIYEHCCALVKSRIMPGNAKFVVTSLSVDIHPHTGEIIETDTDGDEDASSQSSSLPNDVEEVKVNKSNELQSIEREPQIFSFKPLSTLDRVLLCSILNVVNEYKGEESEGCSETGKIIESHSVANNNDAFFRAISYAISGTEFHHRKIRLQVVKHIQCKPNIFKPFLSSEYSSVQQYLYETGMKYLGTPATEIEMYGVADLLQTNIHLLANTWMHYYCLENNTHNPHAGGNIYLKRCGHLYEVILKMMKEDGKEGECASSGNQLEQHAPASSVPDASHLGAGTTGNSTLPSTFAPESTGSQFQAEVTNSTTDSCSKESPGLFGDLTDETIDLNKGTKKKMGGMGKKEYNAKKRQQAYEKYWKNEEYRIKKREEARKRYRLFGGCLKEITGDAGEGDTSMSQNVSLTSKKKKQNDRYWNDVEYRQKKLKKAYERYHSDESYREKKKVYNKTKYHSDEEFRVRVQNCSKVNYAKNKVMGTRRRKKTTRRVSNEDEES